MGAVTAAARPRASARPPRPSPARPGVVAAGWALLAVLLGWTWGALLPALGGVFSLPAAGVTGLVVAGLVWRARPDVAGAARSGARWAAAAVLVAVAATAVHIALPSEQLTSGRDGGTYSNTAAWLERDGDLVIEAGVGPFATAADPAEAADGTELGLRVAGFQRVGAPDELHPQFLHAFPAMLATGYAVGGLDGLLVVNPLLGGLALLAVFGAASRVVRPGWALLAQVAVAVNLVTVAFTRAPFSELLAVAMTFGGLWALDVVRDVPRRGGAVVAGLLLGGVALARLDGLVLVVVLAGIVAAGVLDRRHTGRSAAGDPPWLWPLVGLGAALSVTVAVVDTAIYSPFYLSMHTQYLAPIAAALAAVGLAVAVATSGLGGRAWRRARALGPRLAPPVGVVLVLLALFAWVVRPEIAVDRWGRTTPIGALQQAAGQPVDESRTYGEQTMRWLSWYMGVPGLALGLAGWIGLVVAVLRGRRRRTVPLLLLVSSLTTLYLALPSITPDHIWAMRRFLTVGLPGLAIFGVVAAQAAADRVARSGPRWTGRAVGVVAVAALLVPPAVVTAPFAGLHERGGVAAGFDEACARLGDDAAVLVTDAGFLRWSTTQSWRSFCGLPAAWLDGRVAPERLARLAGDWAAEGRQLWLVSADTASLREAAPDELLGEPRVLVDVVYESMEQRIDGPPQTTVSGRLHAAGAPVSPSTPSAGSARP